jgi:hypothetical protein
VKSGIRGDSQIDGKKERFEYDKNEIEKLE